MAMGFDLIPPRSQVTSNGESSSQDITGSKTRTFLCTLEVTAQIEQESLDVSIWGSEDGQNWGTKPLLKLPQRFYRGQTRQILDLTLRPEVKSIRARWELVRWGRVAPTPMFVIGLRLDEVPAFPQPRVTEKAPTAN